MRLGELRACVESSSEGCTMGIDVAMVNESREPEQQVFDSRGFLGTLAMNLWAGMSSSVCLRFVDPWGDTVFNQAQIPVLLTELKQCQQNQTDQEIKDHLEKVIRLVSQAEGRSHTYIEFSGD
jgi:hypothetical protein